MSTNKNTNADEAIKWEEVKCEHLIKDEWIDFRKTAYKLPDGRVFEPYYNYSRRDYVVIVAQDTEGNFLCVKQFRPGIRMITTEFPAGGIERTDGFEYGGDKSLAEDALSAAKRELMEETGYESNEWEHILTVPSNATVTDNYAYLYMAKNCRKVAGQSLDDTEFLNVFKYSEKEINEMIKDGEFQQSVHIVAWFLSKKICTLLEKN